MEQDTNRIQMSDTILNGIFLAMAGGFMDAYSYLLRDQVFANAQTGNMLLFGVYLSEGKWNQALHYFFPVISFAIGISIAEVICILSKKKSSTKGVLHWRQVAVLVEIAVLFGVSFLSLDYNLLANCLTSLGCGIQVESFRKIHGNAIATTMCIGNLRSATQHMCNYVGKHKLVNLRKSALYFCVIGCFIIGAILGNVCIKAFAERAILFSLFFLLIAFFLMFKETVDNRELGVLVHNRKNKDSKNKDNK